MKLFAPSRTPSGSFVRLAVAAALGSAVLAGCYVVPIQPVTAPPAPVSAVAVAPGPVAQTFTARLYPANAEAARYGTVTGVVTNEMTGHGRFSTSIDGEFFQGEATRAAGNGPRGGMADASGTRGGILSCRYTMNSATLGTGQCVLNNGPAFTMHIGG